MSTTRVVLYAGTHPAHSVLKHDVHMLERFPLLSIILLSAGVVGFGLLAVWLWLSVGLISATLLIIALLLAVPWLYRYRPWAHHDR